MHRFRTITKDGLTIVGVSLFIYGVASIYAPAAFIVSGGVLLFVAYRMEREKL
ncbi:MAG: hypothetical protein DHS20C16_03440 [Phycisphaerae bacterium]|nr:MAG: hypothetical protein DHS20C16_03440 [Phycisphaerae bacterium]